MDLLGDADELEELAVADVGAARRVLEVEDGLEGVRGQLRVEELLEDVVVEGREFADAEDQVARRVERVEELARLFAAQCKQHGGLPAGLVANACEDLGVSKNRTSSSRSSVKKSGSSACGGKDTQEQ